MNHRDMPRIYRKTKCYLPSIEISRGSFLHELVCIQAWAVTLVINNRGFPPIEIFF